MSNFTIQFNQYLLQHQESVIIPQRKRMYTKIWWGNLFQCFHFAKTDENTSTLRRILECEDGRWAELIEDGST